MANKTFYFNDDEMTYLASQADGYVRKLVQVDMAASMPQEVVRQKFDTPEMEDAVRKAVAGPFVAKIEVGSVKEQSKEKGWYCSKCNAVLPYFKAGKCKACNHKMKWS